MIDMVTCEHCQTQLWDYLYGLLDETEARMLRAHLDACPSCRATLAQSEAQRDKLARAAMVIHAVPLFSTPGQEELEPAASPATVAEPQAGPAETAAAEAVPPARLPFSPPAEKPRRAALPRRVLGWSAAAAVLVAAAGLFQAFQAGLAQRQAEVADARKKIEALDARFAALQVKVDQEKKELEALAEKARTTAPEMNAKGLTLQVLAAATIQKGAAQNVQVTTLDQDGNPQPAQLVTKVLDAATKKVLHQQEQVSTGKATVQLPGLKPANSSLLIVEAKSDKGTAVVQETQSLVEPSHATHLAINKSTYQVGEVVFFRALTLDRFTLKPPAEPIPLRFSLVDAAGRLVKELTGQTGPGGISFGELPLTKDLSGGSYTFQVTAQEKTGTRVPQVRNLEIIRDDTPQVVFDRNVYKPGETANIEFRGGKGGAKGSGLPLANQPATVTLQQNGQALPPMPGATNASPIQLRLDQAGNAAFQVQIPPNLQKNNLEIGIQIHDGKKDARFVQTIPVQPTPKTIDFFPEGGDLVAGVPNKVYYRVRSPEGEPADPEGHVIVLASKSVLHDSERGQGLGYFTCVPQIDETYSVRITGSGGVTTLDQPFAKLLKPDGVAVHVPKAVSGEGEALPLVLHVQGKERRLLLQTTCRGRVVDQQFVEVAAGSNEVNLQPAAGANGILRLTVFDAASDRLVPLAERLIYRVPARRLDVSCDIGAAPAPYGAVIKRGKTPFLGGLTPFNHSLYSGGQSLNMRIKAQDETKKAVPTWMLAAVVDEKFRAERTERGLAAHFFLAGEFGDDLDGANLVLNDTPETRRALDLFLGTQGWRRFVRAESTPLLAVDQTRAKDAKGPVQAAALFSKQSPPPQKALEKAQNNQALRAQAEQVQMSLDREVSDLIARVTKERADLLDAKDIQAANLERAVSALLEFGQLPGQYFRVGLGLAALAILAVGALFLAIGLIRTLRQMEKSPTVSFAVGFSCLYAVLFLCIVQGQLPALAALAILVVGSLFLAIGLFRPLRQKEQSPTVSFAVAFSCLFAVLVLYIVQGQLPALDDRDPRAAGVQAALPMKQNNWPEFVPVKPAPVQKQQQTTATPKNQVPEGYFIAQAPVEQEKGSTGHGRKLHAKSAQQAKKAHDPYVARAQAQAPPSPPLTTAPGVAGPPNDSFQQPTQAMRRRYETALKQYPVADTKALSERKKGNEAKQDNTGYLRDFAYRSAALTAGAEATLLWNPALFSADGAAQEPFFLPHNLTTYRVLIYAHSPDGRLGFFEGHLDVRPASGK